MSSDSEPRKKVFLSTHTSQFGRAFKARLASPEFASAYELLPELRGASSAPTAPAAVAAAAAAAPAAVAASTPTPSSASSSTFPSAASSASVLRDGPELRAALTDADLIVLDLFDAALQKNAAAATTALVRTLIKLKDKVLLTIFPQKLGDRLGCDWLPSFC
jgi:hypothetical protein